jgi:hypothetical protein
MFRWAILVAPMYEYYGSSMIAPYEYFARAPRRLEQEGAINSERSPAEKQPPSAFLSSDACGTQITGSPETRLGADSGDHRALLLKAQDLA